MKLLLGLLLSTLSIIETVACSCNGTYTVKEAYSSADLVVVGKVIRLSYVGLAETMGEIRLKQLKKKITSDKQHWLKDEFIIKVEVEVTTMFKGSSKARQVIVYTGFNSASCGYTRFEIGKEFAVYGLKKSPFYWLVSTNSELTEGLERPGTYWTNHCLRTTDSPQSEVVALKTLKKG
jgi:hypothetical protein